MANRTRRLQRRLPENTSIQGTSAQQQQQQYRNSRFWCMVFSVIGFFILNVLVLILATTGESKSTSATTASFMTPPMPDDGHRRFDTPDQVPDPVVSQLDAILVLGGGVPRSVVEPPIFVQRRLDDAVAIVKRRRKLMNKDASNDLLPILCLSAGTAHLPQLLSADGLPVWEATASAGYLLQHHADTISRAQLFVETTSYDTIGNAFYARTSFTDVTGWRRLLIITNEFHMDRSQAIFDWIFGIPSIAQQQQQQQQQAVSTGTNTDIYQLRYLAPPNFGMTPAAVEARKEREANSLNFVRTTLMKKYQTMAQVWEFLTREHGLYTAGKLVKRGQQQPDSGDAKSRNEALKESYGGAKVQESLQQQPTPSNAKADKDSSL